MKKTILFILAALFIISSFFIINLRPEESGENDDYPEEYKNAELDAVVDEWNFYNRECTSFVAWRLNSQNKINFTNQYGGVSRWGNAENWGAVAESLNIKVDTVPKAGSVAWWGSGHVAWVQEVKKATVIIEEYNVPRYSGKYQRREIPVSEPDGYIHIKDLAPDQPSNNIA